MVPIESSGDVGIAGDPALPARQRFGELLRRHPTPFVVGADLELEVAERAENGEDNRPGRLVVEVREHALAQLRPDPLEGDGRRDHA